MIKKEWKEIPGYDGSYFVSNTGSVKTVSRSVYNGKAYFTSRTKLLKKSVGKTGYLSVLLCKNGKTKRFYVHILVAQAFIPNINNLTQINHKDGKKSNNHVLNLEWCSPQDNIIHRYNVLKKYDSFETCAKKSRSKMGKNNFFYGKNPHDFRKNDKKIEDCQEFIKNLKKMKIILKKILTISLICCKIALCSKKGV